MLKNVCSSQFKSFSYYISGKNFNYIIVIVETDLQSDLQRDLQSLQSLEYQDNLIFSIIFFNVLYLWHWKIYF